MEMGKRRGHDVSCPYTEKSRSLDYARDDDEREARTLRPAPPVRLLLRLVLAPGAGSTTVGGIATRCVCRLRRWRRWGHQTGSFPFLELRIITSPTSYFRQVSENVGLSPSPSPHTDS